MSLRNVRYALDGDDDPKWQLRESLKKGVWPKFSGQPEIVSVRAVMDRFSRPGGALREMAGETRNVWSQIKREWVVDQLRYRLRDAATMNQNPTDLCGPYSILMEFARRNRTRFVRGAAELLRDGVFTTVSGRKFEAAEDLRGRPVPDGPVESLEWLYAATMRDSENVSDDIDNGEGIEGITWPFEIEEWIEDVLGLKGDYFPCVLGGELGAIKAGQRAVENGGVAVLLVDKNIFKHVDGDNEEQLSFRSRLHNNGGGVEDFGPRRRCKDDDYPPDHYTVLLGGLRGASEDASEIRLMTWCYGKEFEVSGKPEALGEYLYGVMTGEP